MAKITFRRIKPEAWINDTWLAPYCRWLVKLIEYKNGRMDLWLDGHLYKHAQECKIGSIKKILTSPIKFINS